MDHNTLLKFLIGILSTLGALHVLPLIIRTFTSVAKDCLTEIGEFVLWYRDWKSKYFPPQPPTGLSMPRDATVRPFRSAAVIAFVLLIIQA